MPRAVLGFCYVALWSVLATAATAKPLAIATFNCDATPPLGSALCYSSVPPAQKIVDPLSVRGIVLLGDGAPIVLCAVDWVGIGNGGNSEFRQALARAAGTSVDRVVVHTLHQHDAPGCDFEAEQLLAAQGLSGSVFDVASARATIARAAEALQQAMKSPRAVTHLGVGSGTVERVASNRRILGPDGKVKHVRYSSDKSAEGRDAPEGVIDPKVRLIAFYDGDKPVAVLTYYATHPQSYYGEGGVSYDFVGMARAQREAAVPGVPHIHFNGASGNVAAGKYNDGSPENRPALAGRLAAGMAAAWNSVKRSPIDGGQIGWQTRDVLLPLSAALEDTTPLEKTIANSGAMPRERARAALDLAWTRRVKGNQPISLACLRLGSTYVLHMPGELFIEYQLAAAAMRPQDTVCMAAYGDYGPGYIGTQIAYSQGGYETSYVSRVSPQVENVLMSAMRELLK